MVRSWLYIFSFLFSLFFSELICLEVLTRWGVYTPGAGYLFFLSFFLLFLSPRHQFLRIVFVVFSSELDYKEDIVWSIRWNETKKRSRREGGGERGGTGFLCLSFFSCFCSLTSISKGGMKVRQKIENEVEQDIINGAGKNDNSLPSSTSTVYILIPVSTREVPEAQPSPAQPSPGSLENSLIFPCQDYYSFLLRDWFYRSYASNLSVV